MACALSEDSGQPGHPRSLIRVFAVRMKKAWVLSYPLSAQRRPWSDWADAQADLSLRWAQSFCCFCHEAAHFVYTFFSLLQVAPIFLLCLKSEIIKGIEVECDWSIARYQCPLYGTTDWECLKTRLGCSNGEQYHCVRNGNGSWMEVCGQEKICGKGVYHQSSKNLDIQKIVVITLKSEHGGFTKG